ncbi:hypothetical protein Taro_019329 [Colocasia esculenta]|uniref:Uncharacterized protein n=1 Tax=Colocasia esculenta TaxID=4460 RepID=A0A843UW18_COLES|nr:hypothetical protein [Colocasia esculenta]
MFVPRMKTPVQDPVCVKLHKGPWGEGIMCIQGMTKRPGSCRSYDPMERDPRRFYETVCTLLGPAYGMPLKVLGLSK